MGGEIGELEAKSKRSEKRRGLGFLLLKRAFYWPRVGSGNFIVLGKNPITDRVLVLTKIKTEPDSLRNKTAQNWLGQVGSVWRWVNRIISSPLPNTPDIILRAGQVENMSTI